MLTDKSTVSSFHFSLRKCTNCISGGVDPSGGMGYMEVLGHLESSINNSFNYFKPEIKGHSANQSYLFFLGGV